MQQLTATSADVEVLRQAYEAFNRGEFESVLALMHPDVDWANGMEGGRVPGRDAVRDYWNRQFQTHHSRVDPLAFTSEADGRIAVRVHQIVHEKSGKLLVDQIIEHVYRLRDGKITSMEIRN